MATKTARKITMRIIMRPVIIMSVIFGTCISSGNNDQWYWPVADLPSVHSGNVEGRRREDKHKHERGGEGNTQAESLMCVSKEMHSRPL